MKKQLKTDLYGVIGLGRFGTALVQTLAEAGKEVIAIDKNEEKVKAVRRYTDYAFVVDNLSEDALKETGMQNCGTVTVCIGEQVDISILTTMLVIKLGVPQVIAKAASEVHGEVLKRLGATVVYPEADMAVGGKLLGRTIRELDVRKVYGINIIAVERDHRTDVEFAADYRFEEGDTVSVVGKVEKIDRFERTIQE